VAQLGTSPTKTSVTITIDDDGTNARIGGATPQQAGVMTSEQARVVEQIRILLMTGELTTNIQTLGRQASSLPLGDLSLPPPVEVLPPNHSDDIVRRVSALERMASNPQDHNAIVNSVTALRDQIGNRLHMLEARVGNLEVSASADPEVLNRLQIEVQEMGQVFAIMKGMIEDPTPVMVEK